jgi:hypothetical protein
MAYLLLWGTFLWQALRGLRRTPAKWRALMAGVVGSLVALSVHSLVDNLFVHALNMQFALYLGILAVLHSAAFHPGEEGGSTQ